MSYRTHFKHTQYSLQKKKKKKKKKKNEKKKIK